MKNILVLGAGNIGSVASNMLASCDDYQLTIADLSRDNLDRLPDHPRITPLLLDISNESELQAAVKNQFAVLNCCPFNMTLPIAKSAVAEHVHYLDLTEDVAATKAVQGLAKDAACALIPQCGLAPGFVSIATFEIAKQFDELRNVRMRVGALPKYPSNALKYNLTWSTEGLINEYCNPCEAIVEGELTQVPPLEEIETFSLDGVTYEAFNTSGGPGTLCATLAGQVTNLNYRTVRYPGHRDVMKILLDDLRLRDDRALLKQILESALPFAYQDVVLVFINVSGIKDGRLVEESYANKLYHQTINNRRCSAIQVTTAASVCAVLDLLSQGTIPQSGFIRQEDIDFNDFIANRFGRYFVGANPACTVGS